MRGLFVAVGALQAPGRRRLVEPHERDRSCRHGNRFVVRPFGMRLAGDCDGELLRGSRFMGSCFRRSSGRGGDSRSDSFALTTLGIVLRADFAARRAGRARRGDGLRSGRSSGFAVQTRALAPFDGDCGHLGGETSTLDGRTTRTLALFSAGGPKLGLVRRLRELFRERDRVNDWQRR